MRLHPGYEFKLWTDESARELVAEDYPDYLDMCAKSVIYALNS